MCAHARRLNSAHRDSSVTVNPKRLPGTLDDLRTDPQHMPVGRCGHQMRPPISRLRFRQLTKRNGTLEHPVALDQREVGCDVYCDESQTNGARFTFPASVDQGAGTELRTPPDALQKCMPGVVPLIATAGAELVSRGTPQETVVGDGRDRPDLAAVIRFPSAEAIRGFLDSHEYQARVAFRSEAFEDVRSVRSQLQPASR